MRPDLISPPRLGLLDRRAGRSAASWDMRISPKLCACVPSTRLGCERGAWKVWAKLERLPKLA